MFIRTTDVSNDVATTNVSLPLSDVAKSKPWRMMEQPLRHIHGSICLLEFAHESTDKSNPVQDNLVIFCRRLWYQIFPFVSVILIFHLYNLLDLNLSTIRRLLYFQENDSSCDRESGRCPEKEDRLAELHYLCGSR